jgi:hypothetical protein
MITKLPEWYRVITITTATAETLEKRSATIKKIVKEKDLSWFLDCIRLFVDKPIANTNFRQEMVKAFQEGDPMFLERDNDLELRVLAGAIVNEVIETSGPKSKNRISVALALLSSVFYIKEGSLINKDIVDSAISFLQNSAAEEREQAETKSLPKINLDTTMPDANPATITAKLTTLNDQILKFTTTLTDKLEAANNKIAALEEESNVHWWIFRGVSDTLEKPMTEVEAEQAPLIIGHELGTLVGLPPFAPAYQFFIIKVMKDSFPDGIKETSIKDSVNSLDSRIKTHTLVQKSKTFGNICPVFNAIDVSQQSSDANGWTSIYEKSVGIKSTEKVSPKDLASQFFIENMLLKFS